MPVNTTSEMPISNESLTSMPTVSLGLRTRLFVALIITQIVSNIDGGGCAVLAAFPNGTLTQYFNLSAFQVGALLSAVYVGHTAGCLAAAFCLFRWPWKYVLCLSMVAYSYCVLVFALSSSFLTFFIARIVGGFVSSFIIVIGPIWVDDFAPPKFKSTWMSTIQVGVPLGITIGYVTIGFLDINTQISWRYFFFTQSILIMLLAIFFVVSPRAALNHHMKAAAPPLNAVAVSPFRVIARIGRLILNPVYIALVLGLCVLYFVVNGLQMWVTSYLQGPPVRADTNAIVAVFGITSVTAPVAGVLFGGWAIDCIGGYKDIFRTSIAGLVLGSLGSFCAIMSLFAHELIGFAVCTWLLLFFGGAVVPALVGMTISTVERRLRPIASGFSSCAYNLLGFFLGPFICGTIAQRFGVIWGYRSLMIASSLSVIFVLFVPFYIKFKGNRTLDELNSLSSPVAMQSEQDMDTAQDNTDSDIRQSFMGSRPSFAVS